MHDKIEKNISNNLTRKTKQGFEKSLKKQVFHDEYRERRLSKKSLLAEEQNVTALQ